VKRALVLVLLVLFGLSACRAPMPARRGGRAEPKEVASADDVVVRAIAAPEGTRLEMACTPTGPEICFNATDDNCNGVIDEGCGVHTGPLQFSIAWDEGADVDLNVTDPAGEAAKLGASSGLAKDRDCPGQQCHGQNMENVYFVGDHPPQGRYEVEVKLEQRNDAHLPIRVRFGGRVGAKTFGLTLSLASPDEEKNFAFTLSR
jgi:hypothetical protein